MFDNKITHFKQRPMDREMLDVSRSIFLHGFFIYILCGLLAVALYWVISVYYATNMPGFYLAFGYLLMYFVFGLLLFRIIQRYNTRLLSLQKTNAHLNERLHSTITQEAQQLKLAALGRFSASIAHELRNPLGAIFHAIQLLGEDGQLNPEDTHLKQLVIKNCDRMNAVIKNVLQLSRREPSQPQRIELGCFLEQFKQDFCHVNTCDLKIILTNEVHTVWFDKSQLEQVLVILCDNSMQHGHKEGVVNITLSVTVMAGNTVLRVSDLGKGIPVEHDNKIFEPFFTTLRSGTGMGLFIARDLCEINQARLDLEKTTTGSCFVITINSSDDN